MIVGQANILVSGKLSILDLQTLINRAGIEARNPFAVPDWRNEANYPQPSMSELPRWTWEFSRRTEGARHSWLEAMIAYSECPDDQLYREAVLCDVRLPHEAFKKHLPWPDYTVFGFLNPQENIANNVMFALGANGEAIAGVTTSDIQIRMFRSRESVLAIIDLDKPLAQQFEKIEEIVANKMLTPKRSGKRHLTANYSIYLRVLDARDETTGDKSSWMEIARALFPNYPGKAGEDKARETFEQACNTLRRLLETPHAV